MKVLRALKEIRDPKVIKDQEFKGLPVLKGIKEIKAEQAPKELKEQILLLELILQMRKVLALLRLQTRPIHRKFV
jgi:hypothetical protein